MILDYYYMRRSILKVFCVVAMILVALIGNVLVILSVVLNKSMRYFSPFFYVSLLIETQYQLPLLCIIPEICIYNQIFIKINKFRKNKSLVTDAGKTFSLKSFFL